MGIGDVIFLIIGIFFIILGILIINHYIRNHEKEEALIIILSPFILGIICIISVITGYTGLMGLLIFIITSILYIYGRKYPKVKQHPEVKEHLEVHKKFVSSVILRTVAVFCVILILFILIRVLFY